MERDAPVAVAGDQVLDVDQEAVQREERIGAMSKRMEENMVTLPDQQRELYERMEGNKGELNQLQEALGAQMKERCGALEGRVTALETKQSSLSESDRSQEVIMEEFAAQEHSSTSQSFTPPTSSLHYQNIPVCTAASMHYFSIPFHQAETPASTLTASTASLVVPVPSSSDFISQSRYLSQAVNYLTTCASTPSCMPSYASTSLYIPPPIPLLSTAIVLPTAPIAGGNSFRPMDSVRTAQHEDVEIKLFQAAYEGRIDEVQRLVLAGANVNSQSSRTLGLTALHVAAFTGDSAITAILIMKGAEVNILSPNRRTPLHLAAFKGKAYVIFTLLNCGADANTQDKTGNSPLHDAVMWNGVAPARALINFGADMNLQTNVGNTPLHMALLNNREETAMELVSAGASLTIRNYEGEYPLHCAARFGNAVVVQALAAKTYRNLQTNEGNSPLHYAVKNGNLAALHALISAGESVNVQNINGESPLHWAARMGNEAVVLSLIAAGTNKELI